MDSLEHTRYQQSHGDTFWDAHGVIHIDHRQKERPINGEKYTNLLDLFKDDLQEKDRIWPGRQCYSTKTMQEGTSA